jgi:hypothetical protein
MVDWRVERTQRDVVPGRVQLRRARTNVDRLVFVPGAVCDITICLVPVQTTRKLHRSARNHVSNRIFKMRTDRISCGIITAKSASSTVASGHYLQISVSCHSRLAGSCSLSLINSNVVMSSKRTVHIKLKQYWTRVKLPAFIVPLVQVGFTLPSGIKGCDCAFFCPSSLIWSV